MSIAVPGLPSSRKTPGVFLSVQLGATPTSAGAVPKKVLVIGNLIGTALTGASPAFSVAAGTATVATPYLIPSEGDAITYFGRGSELHWMCKGVLAQYPDAQLYGCAAAEASGTAATAVLTFATAASAAFTVRLKLCGQVIDVGVASGDSITTTATAVAEAINDAADLPYTAQNSAGVVTITAKHEGPRGNTLIVDAYFVSSTGAETRIGASSTSSGAGTTGTWSTIATESTEFHLQAGATQDSIATVLTNIEPVKYDRIVIANIDSTNVGRLVTALNSQAAVTVQKRQQGVAPSADTNANAITLATGQNAPKLQLVWHYNSRIPIWAVAAQTAAARLIGDGVVGGRVIGEATDPAANLDGCELRDVIVQPYVGDQPTATEIESALNNGVTPIIPSANRPGYCAIARSITTRSLSGGVPSYSVLDTTNVTVCDYVADDLQSDLATTYAGAKLAADSSDGLPPRAQGVVTPSIVRSHIAGKLKGYEEDGILTDVDANMSLLAVEIDNAVAGRLNANIPCEPIPGLHIFGGNVIQAA